LTQQDVVVIGGGPGGAVCAALLATHGRSVVLLEKARFPRFHLGESLLPVTMPVLRRVGVLDAARERFLVKHGAHFHSPEGKRARYGFEEAHRSDNGWALQVARDEFDELLLRHAASRGVDVREEWEATRVVFDGASAVAVEAGDAAGRSETLEARVVVDATGRDAIMARAAQSSTRIAGLDKTAIFTHVRGAWRDEGRQAGDIQIVLFDGGWFWLIPFVDGRTSVGAVVGRDWIRRSEARDPGALFERALADAPVAAKMIDGAERLFAPRATADFSARVGDLSGDGWLAVGDAGGFIDPLFSTGAHLAICGAAIAADAIHAALEAGDVSRSRFVAWEAEMRSASEMFVGVVQAFYDGSLTRFLFAEPQHPVLKKSITSLLSGDVFGEDARWRRDLRARFPPRA
jgi:flavin-dependent dehydrogenase